MGNCEKKLLIVGFSVTGIGCARVLADKYSVFVTEFGEKKEQDNEVVEELLSKGVKIEFGGHSDEFVLGSDFAILSPSIPQNAPILAKLKEQNIPYFSDIEFLQKIDESSNVVMITGTNGKTTTTMLVSHILSKKFNAPTCGNIGVSPIAHVDSKPDYYVVEASSYQLNYTGEFAPKIGIFTNLTPDHISWHGGLEEYFQAKAKPFFNMDENSFAILNFDDKKVCEIADKTKAKVCYFAINGDNLPQKENNCYVAGGSIFWGEEKIIEVKDVPIVGNHNLQNVMCAILAAKCTGMDNETIASAIKTFRAPKHRCELIRTLSGTEYFNDSKATNPEASIVAIQSFEGKKVVLIAGGRDKNTSLDEFVEVVKKCISKVVLIGEATERFTNELYSNGFSNIVHAQSLEEAIDLASLDLPDVVLLSPACASFDMFKSYEERGEVFSRYVLSKKQLLS